MNEIPTPGTGAGTSEPVDRMHRLFTRASSRIVLSRLGVVLLLIVGALWAGREIEHHIAGIESWIARLGLGGVLVFVGLFVVATSLLFPDTVLCIAAGALFGIGWGSAAVAAAGLAAAVLQFALARRLLRKRIERVLASKPSLAAIREAVLTDEFRLQVLLRLTPLNPATISYLLGAAGVRFRGFVLASLATLPGLLIEVYLGHAGKHAAGLAAGGRHPDRLHDLVVFGGLLVCLAVMILVSRMARRAVGRAVGGHAAGRADSVVQPE